MKFSALFLALLFSNPLLAMDLNFDPNFLFPLGHPLFQLQKADLDQFSANVRLQFQNLSKKYIHAQRLIEILTPVKVYIVYWTRGIYDSPEYYENAYFDPNYARNEYLKLLKIHFCMNCKEKTDTYYKDYRTQKIYKLELNSQNEFELKETTINYSPIEQNQLDREKTIQDLKKKREELDRQLSQYEQNL